MIEMNLKQGAIIKGGRLRFARIKNTVFYTEFLLISAFNHQLI